MAAKAVIFFMVFSTATAVAQDAPVAVAPDTAQAQQEAGGQQAEDKVGEAAPETFDPTEEISEDYSIDFPVDI